MKSLAELTNSNEFIRRHIGPSEPDQQAMLKSLGYKTMADFIGAVVPDNIRSENALALGGATTEQQALTELREIANQNQVLKNYIGQGYYNCITPNVILRNVLENPAWYTAYTPYQPEISKAGWKHY